MPQSRQGLQSAVSLFSAGKWIFSGLSRRGEHINRGAPAKTEFFLMIMRKDPLIPDLQMASLTKLVLVVAPEWTKIIWDTIPTSTPQLRVRHR